MVDLPLLVAMLLHGNNPDLVDLPPHHGSSLELAVPLLHHGLHPALTAMDHLLVETQWLAAKVLPGNQADTVHTKHQDTTMLMDLMATTTHRKHHHHRQEVPHLGSNNHLHLHHLRRMIVSLLPLLPHHLLIQHSHLHLHLLALLNSSFFIFFPHSQ